MVLNFTDVDVVSDTENPRDFWELCRPYIFDPMMPWRGPYLESLQAHDNTDSRTITGGSSHARALTEAEGLYESFPNQEP